MRVVDGPDPEPPPLPVELDAVLRRLRMLYVRRAAPEMIATAISTRWETVEVLGVLLAEEAAGRDQATIRMRRRQSALLAGKTFDAWEERASAIPKPTQHALHTLEWIGRAENLCLAGRSGSGKSHFVEALGQDAIDHGKPVAWHTLWPGGAQRALAARPTASTLRDDSASGRTDGHQREEDVAAIGENR